MRQQAECSVSEEQEAFQRQQRRLKEVGAKQLFFDIPALICDSRRGEAKKLTPAASMSLMNPCSSASADGLEKQIDVSCEEKMAALQQRARQLWQHELPLCLQLVVVPQYCAAADQCLVASQAPILERWTLALLPKRRAGDAAPVAGHFLLQAVRSFLHFSQLNAWTSKSAGNKKPSFKIVYKVSLPGDMDTPSSSAERAGLTERHSFPPCQHGKSRVLTVGVESLGRLDRPPAVHCSRCLPPTSSQATADEDEQEQLELSNPSLLIRFMPIVLPNRRHSASSASTWRQNPLFEVDDRLQQLRLRSPPPPAGVRFFIGDCIRQQQRPEENRVDEEEEEGEEGGATEARPKGRRKRQSSQKILFSEEHATLTASPESVELVIAPADSAYASAAPSASKAHKPEPDSTCSSMRPSSSRTPKALSSCRRELFAKLRFSAATGLPLMSSPAPLKRNQHSFDFDASLSSVAGLKHAFYAAEHDSGSSDSESGSTCCKSAPASTGLLGNFEESALNGRIKPFGSVEAASGAFCPPHVRLAVTTFFFSLSEDNAPSPYLGHVSLEGICRRKGYHVPKRGTVQATLFNPQGTVVKMFVVRYDLLDMPVSSQTFVRQRTFFMPSDGSIEDARRNRTWLRYLIHLRFATSKSGKLYLHSDIRMLFSRKSELDAYNLETNNSGGGQAAPGQVERPTSAVGRTFELRSFTEMPKDPKYSPRRSAASVAAAASNSAQPPAN